MTGVGTTSIVSMSADRHAPTIVRHTYLTSNPTVTTRIVIRSFTVNIVTYLNPIYSVGEHVRGPAAGSIIVVPVRPDHNRVAVD